VSLPLAAFGVLFALLFAGLPIGLSLLAVGVGGFAVVAGAGPAFAMLGQVTVDTVLNYNFSVLPLFVLMGNLFSLSRMADELYAASNAFLGHRRGGLAMATILACGGFSAVSGSSIACGVTMAKISVPTMRRYGYAPGFACGTVAAGATLDILIPPSIAMVLFSLITDTNLGALMVAGIVPGLVTVALYLVAIAVAVRLRPGIAPEAGTRVGWAARLRSLRDVWPMVLLFGLVLGGIYFGVCTPTEGAGVGAAGAFGVTWMRGRITWPALRAVLVDTVETTSLLFVVLVGALVFANFVTVSGTTQAFDGWVRGLDLGATELILLIFGLYLLIGCVLEANSMMVLTVPIFFPAVTAAGIDPVWFGIFVVVVSQIGLVHPPMGLLLFAVRALVPDVRTGAIFAGVLPYLAADAVRVALFIAFPALVLWLPRTMGG
jgi:tripartite ATP-independent transporter DctM subunit